MAPTATNLPFQAPIHSDDDLTKPVVFEEQSLTVGYTPDGIPQFDSIVPSGISVQEGRFGRCLVATKDFAKGDRVYRGYAAIVTIIGKEIVEAPVTEEDEPVADDITESSWSYSSSSTVNDETTFFVNLYDEVGKLMETVVHNKVHSVKDSMDVTGCHRRILFGFDGYINHSCDPNVYTPLVYRSKSTLCFDTIALKNIKAGDEIASDYAHFDYDCDGHEIVDCACGSSICRGSMFGFSGLSLDEKVRIMHMVEEEVIDLFLQNNPDIEILFKSNPKQSNNIVNSSSNGDFFYTWYGSAIYKDELANKTCILKTGERFEIVDFTVEGKLFEI